MPTGGLSRWSSAVGQMRYFLSARRMHTRWMLEVFDMHIDTVIVTSRVPRRLCRLLSVHRNFKFPSHAYLVERRLDYSRYVFGICHNWSLVIDGTMFTPPCDRASRPHVRLRLGKPVS